MINRRDLDRPDSAMLAELRTLRSEIRRASRQANRLAACSGSWGSDAYKATLVDLFDGWIAGSGGQQQLVWFASAAEMGLLLERHVDRCRATAMQSGREILRVLYWTVMRRWGVSRRVRAGEGQSPAPIAPASGASCAPAAPQPLCSECADLLHDSRRASGHPQLHPLSPVERRRYAPHIVLMLCEHRCRSCEARWLMSSHSADPFVGWTLRSSGRASEIPSAVAPCRGAPGSGSGRLDVRSVNAGSPIPSLQSRRGH